MAMVKNISYLSNTIFSVPSGGKVDHAESGDTSDSSVSDEYSTAEQSGPAKVLSNFDRAGTESDENEDDGQSVTKQQLDVLTADGDISEAAFEELECIEFEDLSCRPIDELPMDELPDEDGSTNIDLNVNSSASASPKKLKTSRQATTKQQSAIDLDSYADIISQTHIRQADIDHRITIDEAVEESYVNNLVTRPTYEIVNVSTEVTIPSVPISAVVQATDVPIDSHKTIHTMNYAEFMRALNQNIYVIPADQNFNGIADSFENAGSIHNAIDVVADNEVERQNEFEMQRKSASQTTPHSRGNQIHQAVNSKIVTEGTSIFVAS